LYVVADGGVAPDERTMGLLHGLYRAIITDPEPDTLPNIEFIVGREDWVDPKSTIWGLTKRREDKLNWMVS